MNKKEGHMCKYNSILRVQETNLDDLWEKLKKYNDAFDEILFFSQFTHSVKNLAEHRETSKRLDLALKKTQKMGIKAGIDVLTTVGFFPENLDEDLMNMKKTVNLDGSINYGRLCSFSKENIEYIKELYHIYAATSADVIYIDDDISGYTCFCPECIKRFEEHYKVFGILEPTRENLNALFESNNRDIRKQSREAWISYNALRISELYEIIEKAVHEVNPEIPIGAMTYMTGNDGIDTDNWANKLSGNNHTEVRWRPGGGVYTDYDMLSVLDKANRMSAQIRYLPSFVSKVDAEIENFPYQSLKKPPSFTAFEGLIYLASGCTSIAFNVCCKEERLGTEHDAFFYMASQLKWVGNLITDTFGREKLDGVGFCWDKKTAAFANEEKWDMGKSVPFANSIHEIGIPPACETENISVFFLNQATALQLSDEELKRCLSKGVLMDCQALQICNERGFESLTGFEVVNSYDKDTCERELEHALNIEGNHLRNPRQAFGYCGETYTIKKTNNSSEYLAENREISGKLRGMSCGIFENENGGRICVEGITPFDWYYSIPRNTHIKNVLRWLSKDTITAYVHSFHRLSLWSRNGAVFLANMTLEDAQNPEIMIRTQCDFVGITITKGAAVIGTEKINAVSKDGEYRLFKLPVIPITGTALVRPLK